MDFALSEKDVRNIAITGSYGAGKSTIIHSYLEKYRIDSFINVSLAGFELQGKVDSDNAHEVELSILQQILYKKNRDALPDSRIDRILNRNRAHIFRVFWSVLKVTIPLCVTLALINQDKFSKIIGVKLSLLNHINSSPIIKLILMSLFFLLFLYFITECASKIGMFDKKIKLSKLALLSGEMEIESTEKSSLLNNCLDEIVYFFSRIDNYRIVIFEDLDRLKNPDIFVKLREINKIVNNNLPEGDPLIFIYAVRDDIFSGTDSRTKFFDFIIPVVPVMDNMNAFSLLNSKMEKYIPEGGECFRITAAYISNMRTLQNIVNEYQIFSKFVDNKGKRVNLYAMIFYKNMFSHDYNLIDKGISILYKFIDDYRKLKLHKEYFNDIDEEIASLNNELESIFSEKERTAEDVRKSIIYSLIPEKLTGIIFLYKDILNVNYYTPVSQVPANDLINDEVLFKEFFGGTETVSIGFIFNGNRHVINIDNSERERIYESYHNRKRLVGKERSDRFEQVEISLIKAKENKRRRNSITLAELLNTMNKERFIIIASQYIKDINEYKLISDEQKEAVRNEMEYGGYDALYLLLSRGYLDQDFMRSRSIFHEGGLSIKDNEFIKNIALGLSCEDSNKEVVIDDVVGVVREIIAQKLLHNDATMHHQIISYMIQSHDKHIDEMIATIFSRPGDYVLNFLKILESRILKYDIFISFLVKALDENRYIDELITLLRNTNDDSYLKGIVAEVVSLIPPEHSKKIDSYRKYVESLGTGIVHLFRPGRLDAFLQHLAYLKVSYAELSDPLSRVEQDCLHFIGENSFYQLSKKNVGIILSAQLNEKEYSASECERKPWSLARDNNLSAKEYFEINADTFVINVFLKSEEQQDAIEEVLHLSGLSDESKVRIIKEMDFCLDSLANISLELECVEDGNALSCHDLFYKYNKVRADWSNLIQYLNEDCNHIILTGFLSRKSNFFSSSWSDIEDNNSYKNIFNKIICNMSLPHDKYMELIKDIPINTDLLDKSVNDDIIIRLLNQRKINLDPDSFSNVIKDRSLVSGGLIDAISIWIENNEMVLISDPDFYLCKDLNPSVYSFFISRIMNSSIISLETKLSLFERNIDHYLYMDMNDIDLADNVKIWLVSRISNIQVKVNIIISLLSSGINDYTNLSQMLRSIEEKELYKILSQKTATITFNNYDMCIPLLDKLKESSVIRDYKSIGDGKVHIKTMVNSK